MSHTLKDNFCVTSMLIMTGVCVLETLFAGHLLILLSLFIIGHTCHSMYAPGQMGESRGQIAGVVSVPTSSVYWDFIQAIMGS